MSTDYRTTDIFGNPVKPSFLKHKRLAAQKAQRIAGTPAPTLNPVKRPAALPAAITQRPDQSAYLQAAKNGKFKMQGLEQHWTAARLPWAIYAGPTRSDRQQSLQRVIETDLMERVGVDVTTAGTQHISSPVSPARSHSVPPPTQDATAMLLDFELRKKKRNPDASVPTLLHAEDANYVDIYRNYLQDREDRIDYKQKISYLDHNKFVVNPDTKLRTLKEQREAFQASLKPRIVNPAEVPEQFMPMSMLATRKPRHTIEKGDETNTTAVERETFTQELRRLCNAKPPGFFNGQPVSMSITDGASTDNRFVKQVLSTPTEALPPTTDQPAIESPKRLRDAWATMDRAKAYPYQKQVAMQRHIQEEVMTKAMLPVVSTSSLARQRS